MEGDSRSETPTPLAANRGCNHELTRSNSVASSLTAENCKDTLRPSAGVTLDDCTAWTDDKHNLYLNQLEVSFVKQLHQSKRFPAQCSEQNQRRINISQKRLINVHKASEQLTILRNGCWQKINYEKGGPLSSTSAGSRIPPPSADMLESLKLCNGEKHRKRIISHGLDMCVQKFSDSPYRGDLFDLTREGTGQNFLNEDKQNDLNIASQAKRLKTSLADSPSRDQIVPCRKCPATDYSTINSSTLGEELARHESISENFESFVDPPT